MTAFERENLAKLIDAHPRAGDDNTMDYEYEPVTLEDIDRGNIPLDISHAGGEYAEIRKAYEHHLSEIK